MSAQEKNSVFFKMSINKKGVSTIVSTVLILLITVSAIAIISTILIPYVKKSLSSTDCFKTMGELKLEDDPEIKNEDLEGIYEETKK